MGMSPGYLAADRTSVMHVEKGSVAGNGRPEVIHAWTVSSFISEDSSGRIFFQIQLCWFFPT